MASGVCPRCGSEERGPVLCNEALAGAFQSACCHSACAECWRECVEVQLARCSADRMLRVSCPVPGCGRSLAQKLVLQVSLAAQNLANDIDRFDHELRRLNRYGMLPDMQFGGSCPVCHELSSVLLLNNGCNHGACEECWLKWGESQVPHSRNQKQERFRCLGPACVETMARPVLEYCYCCAELSAAAAELKSLNQDIRRRIALQNNPFYPEAVQVDCRRPGCVGLGYLGFDSVMCFICEEQWPVSESASSISEDLPGTLKACPGCRAPIEKNGGCDHMSCRCGHQFYWTTLKPYP